MSSDGDAKHVFDPMAWCDEDTFERDDNPYDPMNCKGNDNGSNAGDPCENIYDYENAGYYCYYCGEYLTL